jgi:hypothetical protein
VIMNKLVVTTFFIILVFFVTSIAIWNIYYIDKTIVDGERYGFVVGESMHKTFERIEKNAIEASYKAVQVGDSSQDFRVISIDELQLNNIENYNSWIVMLDSTSEFLNTIRLDFNSRKLLSIHRHKQLFELP